MNSRDAEALITELANAFKQANEIRLRNDSTSPDTRIASMRAMADTAQAIVAIHNTVEDQGHYRGLDIKFERE